jgi:polyhydroxyalkanoate synthesis regulator phasin
MAENDMLRRYMDAGLAFTQMTRSRARAIVQDMVRAGELQREQTQEWVDDLLERSRKNTEQMLELVRKEVSQQLGSMGLATKEDLAKLEARLRGSVGAKKAAPAKKASAKKGSAKKALPAKKAAATSAPGPGPVAAGSSAAETVGSA